ncbi:MAG TPA: NAD(+) diphosphatase [Gemmatimonadaceae bacterium]|nr:NAD(+) diphosphatase [Gemmatimonadaceae bacterium]
MPEAPRIHYAGGQLDRAASDRKNPAWISAQRTRPGACVVPVWRDRNLVLGMTDDGTEPRAARCVIDLHDATRAVDGTLPWAFLGLDGEAPIFAVDVSAVGDEPPASLVRGGAAFLDLRRVGALVGARDAALLAYARALMHWHRRHQYCGNCGAMTESRHGGHMRRCTNVSCGAEHFPRIDPAVIMLVEHRPASGVPRTCLLARHSRLPSRAFSTLAGFVEPGESLEDAVAREVWEETGVRVSEVTYQASQPWPFPSSLMVGFRALAETDALSVDHEELDEARWFTAAEVAGFGEWGDETARFQLPRRDSIARVLVDAWLADAGRA